MIEKRIEMIPEKQVKLGNCWFPANDVYELLMQFKYERHIDEDDLRFSIAMVDALCDIGIITRVDRAFSTIWCVSTENEDVIMSLMEEIYEYLSED
jgi:hypothetical protein